MQFMINSDTDSIASLRAVAAILLADAATREALPSFAPPPPPPPPSLPTGEDTKVIDAAALAAAVAGAGAPPPPPPPPPPVLPAAPPPAAQTTTTAAPLAELDSEGQPWNAELHAATKTKIANGTWKKKRGAGTKADAPPPPPAGDAPPPPPAAGTAPPPPPPAAPVAETGPTFRSVMAKAKAAVEGGKLTHDKVGELVRKAGAPDLTTLNSMAHLIPQVDALLDAELFGK